MDKKSDKMTGFDEYTCQECHFRSISKLNVEAHHRLAHTNRKAIASDKNNRRYACSECSYVSYEKSSVVSHMHSKHLMVRTALVLTLFAGICIVSTLILIMCLASLLTWFDFRETSETEKDDKCIKERKEAKDDFPEVPDYEPEFQSYQTCVCSSKNWSGPRLLPRMRLPGSLGYEEESEIQTKLKPVVLRTEMRMEEKVVYVNKNIRRRRK